MFICDTSEVDWEAVGALGTWLVGFAALYLASRANSLEQSMRRAEKQQRQVALRAYLISLASEVASYKHAVHGLAESLLDCANIPDDKEFIAGCRDAYTLWTPTPLPSPIDRSHVIGDLSDDLAISLANVCTQSVHVADFARKTRELLTRSKNGLPWDKKEGEAARKRAREIAAKLLPSVERAEGVLAEVEAEARNLRAAMK